MNMNHLHPERIVAELKRQTEIPAVRISARNASRLPLAASKFGGVPYWNPQEPYPCSSDGKKLVLLAQLNLGDVPPLDDFPATGILQFFVGTDTLYGADFSLPTSQDRWRVVYHGAVRSDVTEGAVRALGVPCAGSLCADDFFPLSSEYALSFQKTTVSLGLQSYGRFVRAVKAAAQALGTPIHADDFEAYDLFDEDTCERLAAANAGHWLGGYPCFTQDDPRELSSEFDTLLFQMDSESMDGHDIMWGDTGVANFFISRDALRRRDFSRVMYNWDCC